MMACHDLRDLLRAVDRSDQSNGGLDVRLDLLDLRRGEPLSREEQVVADPDLAEVMQQSRQPEVRESLLVEAESFA
jgi:hypothetical protein